MKHLIFFYFVCLLSMLSNAQNVSLQLFYEINEVQSEKNIQRLDSFLNQIKTKTINVNLNGYADFLADEKYNLFLSQSRANFLKAHLAIRTKPPLVNVLQVNYFGEKMSHDTHDAKGEAYQRRVDVQIVGSSSDNNVDTRPIAISEPVKETKKAVLVEGKKLEAIEIGQSIALEGLSFEPGLHKVLETSIPVMRRLLQTLKDYPKLKIEIQGHVCCVEDFQTDAIDMATGMRNLSVNRAKFVYDYLVKQGIDPLRLKYQGFGHKHPKISPEVTHDDEQLNRRVEVMVVEK